jgi:DNA-binding transcriptional LysR family regulator
MAARITFDLDALRSFVVGIELGGFAKAADRLGRSTSAVSAQLKKLEGQAGAPILRKSGRGLALTPTGETLLAYARRLIELNDEAVAAARGVELEGWVRIGLQEDFGETLLPEALGRFARAHPKVRVEARVERNAALIDGVISGKLDLALAWDAGAATPYCERIAETAMRWIGPAGRDEMWRADGGEPLPVAAMEAPCLFRRVAVDALDLAGISWRLAFVSASLAGVWAATARPGGAHLARPAGQPACARRGRMRPAETALARSDAASRRGRAGTGDASVGGDRRRDAAGGGGAGAGFAVKSSS